MSPSRPPADAPATAGTRPGTVPYAWAIALLAAVARWVQVGGARGLLGYHGYDDGVYFTAAVAFTHGRLPYRDFLLLHPPGVVVALSPVAALTDLLGDPRTLALARVAMIALGVANTLLVARVAARWGSRAAVLAGLAYALHPAAVAAEGLTMLEPLGTASLLAGVLTLQRASRPGARPGWTWAGGAVLGLAATVKLWGGLPVLVVLAWVLIARGRPAVLRACAGAAAAALAVTAPFAWAAGTSMLRMVVLDQLGRPQDPGSALSRLPAILGLDGASAMGRAGLAPAAAVLVALALVATAVAAWRAGRGRLWVVLLVAQSATLLASPSFYPHYAAFVAPAQALVLAAGASTLPAPVSTWLTRGAALVAAVLVIPVSGADRPPSFPSAALAARLPGTGCITADSPAALALTDVLTRDLQRGCPLPVDLSGYSYDVGTHDSAGRPVPRVQNQAWQAYARTYLTSGSAAMLVRPVGNGFDAVTTAALDARTTARLGGVRLLVP